VKKCLSAIVAAAIALGALVGVAPASAASLAGSDCPANEANLGTTLVSLRGPLGGVPDAIPTAGVITNWSFNLIDLGPNAAEWAEQLKVFAPTGVPNQFQVVGESVRAKVVGGGVTSVPTRTPVRAGDLLGNSVLASQGTLSATGAFYCMTENAGDEVAFFEGDPIVGQIVPPSKTKAGAQNRWR
jgi:hypothetical protein